MRMNIEIRLADRDYSIPANFETLERIEKGFGENADVISTVILQHPEGLKMTTLARVVAGVLVGHSPTSGQPLTREEVLDAVVTADAFVISKLALALMSACLYIRRQIGDEELAAMQSKEVDAAIKKLMLEKSPQKKAPSERSTKSPSVRGKSHRANSGK